MFRDFEMEIKIEEPFPGSCFTIENLDIDLTKRFKETDFCIVSFEEYLVSIYLASDRYYYLFDPYSWDICGDRTQRGSAMIMRFRNLTELIVKVVRNLLPPGTAVTDKRYALILVYLTSVTPLF